MMQDKCLSILNSFIDHEKSNPYAAKEGMELGLTNNQVQVRNFGYPTLSAIKKDLKKGIDLQTAYEKYKLLNYQQIQGIRVLGLNREQVQSKNFGYHTVEAITTIQKRSKEISLEVAFALVKSKSPKEVEIILKSYLSATKKAQKPLSEMQCIRVIVNTGRGFGHQRAAITLMQKLRELGFNGVFDIHCDDRYGATLFNSKTGRMEFNTELIVSQRLFDMIPELKTAPSSSDGIKNVPGLGALKLSSLPPRYESEGVKFSPVDLAVCAADDFVMFDLDKKANLFNASAYIGLEPTDWHQGKYYVVDQYEIVTDLPKASQLRLSSKASYEYPKLSSIDQTEVNNRILKIATNCQVNTQLVYGLYPEKVADMEAGGMTSSGNLDESTELQRIVDANRALGLKVGKPAILLLPQDIALRANLQTKVSFIDLSKKDINLQAYKPGEVVIAYTGRLQHALFDYLMLHSTLPPVIEGCNSRELCESAARPFIHGSGKYDNLKQYTLGLQNMQSLHTQASLCLEQGDPRYLPQLVQYMEKSLLSDKELCAYHEQRRAQFYSRPDACELALKTLGIPYLEKSKVISKPAETKEETSPFALQAKDKKHCMANSSFFKSNLNAQDLMKNAQFVQKTNISPQ